MKSECRPGCYGCNFMLSIVDHGHSVGGYDKDFAKLATHGEKKKKNS
jgi:hypothetical protein